MLPCTGLGRKQSLPGFSCLLYRGTLEKMQEQSFGEEGLHIITRTPVSRFSLTSYSYEKLLSISSLCGGRRKDPSFYSDMGHKASIQAAGQGSLVLVSFVVLGDKRSGGAWTCDDNSLGSCLCYFIRKNRHNIIKTVRKDSFKV